MGFSESSEEESNSEGECLQEQPQAVGKRKRFSERLSDSEVSHLF